MEREKLEGLLYRQNRVKYNQIKELSRRFRVQYSRPLVGDGIFSIMQNYVQRSQEHLEILRLPISDSRFQGFTVVRQGEIFMAVNTSLPLAEQNFTAAYELYEIVCHLEKKNTRLIKRGSLVLEGEKKNPEASAFAAMILAPEAEILEQMELFEIEKSTIAVKELVRLMDCFGIPYDMMVLRLYECEIIEAKRAAALLSRRMEAEQYSFDTGIAKRWQQNTRDEISFGELPSLLKRNEEQGTLPGGVIWQDRIRMEEIKEMFLASPH